MKEKVVLSMWTHDNLYCKFYNQVGEKWKEKYPQYDITFNFQQLPEVFTKMLASLSADTEVPDLFGLEQGQFGNFTKNDLIEQKFVDINNYISNERSKFVENTWVKYTYKGKTYGVESALCTVGFYFQPRLLEKAGITELPKTWEEFMEAGMVAADKGTALSALDSEGAAIFDLLFMQRGGRYFDVNSNLVFGDGDNKTIALEVMSYLAAGLKNKVFAPVNGKDYWGAGLMAAHKEGKIMGVPGADWWSNSFENQCFRSIWKLADRLDAQVERWWACFLRLGWYRLRHYQGFQAGRTGLGPDPYRLYDQRKSDPAV